MNAPQTPPQTKKELVCPDAPIANRTRSGKAEQIISIPFPNLDSAPNAPIKRRRVIDYDLTPNGVASLTNVSQRLDFTPMERTLEIRCPDAPRKIRTKRSVSLHGVSKKLSF